MRRKRKFQYPVRGGSDEHTPEKKQTITNRDGDVIARPQENEGGPVGVHRRNTKPRNIAASSDEAPCGAMLHVIHTRAEFNLLKYEEGEDIISATHRGQCSDKLAGYHTHYLIGLYESNESGWTLARRIKRRIRRAHKELPGETCGECKSIARGHQDCLACKSCGFTVSLKFISDDAYLQNVLNYLEKRESAGKIEIAEDSAGGLLKEPLEREILLRRLQGDRFHYQ